MKSLLRRPPASPETAVAQRLAMATELAREFATDAARYDREGTIALTNFEKLATAGLLSLTVPTRLGGAEADLAEVTRIVGRIATGDASTALILAMHYLHVAAIFRSSRWPRPLADRIGLASAAGEIALVNALRVEPELGSPARGGLPATVARRTDDGWLLTGHKIYSTGSSILRWAWSGPGRTTRSHRSDSGWCRWTARACGSPRPGITWACGRPAATRSY